MYLVFTTSTGEAITVVQKPAPNADVKWHGRSSVGTEEMNFCSYSINIQEVYYSVSAYHSLVYFAKEHL